MDATLIEPLIHSFKQLVPQLTEAELDHIRPLIQVREFSKKEILFAADSVQREIAFVVKGLFRVFYVDDQGKEISIRFGAEGAYMTHYYSFIRQVPSFQTIQSLEPSIVATLSYAHIQEAYLKYPRFERYGRLIAEEVLVAQAERIEGFLFKTAEQRYLDFMQHQPELYNRVSLSHLSSYLGIERPSLSRIRKRISGG